MDGLLCVTVALSCSLTYSKKCQFFFSQFGSVLFETYFTQHVFVTADILTDCRRKSTGVLFILRLHPPEDPDTSTVGQQHGRWRAHVVLVAAAACPTHCSAK